MVEVRDISKKFGSVQALRGVSLTAEKGRVLGLLGQNGAGKTTLLNIITGCLAPTTGTVIVNGQDPLVKSRTGQAPAWIYAGASAGVR